MPTRRPLFCKTPRTGEPEMVALVGFLAGLGGRTREVYALDLRKFLAWCTDRQLRCSTPTGATSRCTPVSPRSVARPAPPSSGSG